MRSPVWNMTYRLLTIIIAMVVGGNVYAQKDEKEPILIVTSYNPDVKSMRDNIIAFSEKYVYEGGKHDIQIENMNCKNLPECVEWKHRLEDLLRPYYKNGRHPAAILLIGAEAATAYFSLDNPAIKKTPVLVCQRGNNIVELPEDPNIDLATWEPECKLITKDFKDFNIIGGEVFNYDVEENLNMVKKYFPTCDTLVLVTDNTLGGIAMKSHCMKLLKNHREYVIETIDGREITFTDFINSLEHMTSGKLLLLGTWRIDKTDSYTLKYTTISLGSINTRIPAVTISSVGIGHWAFGGVLPDFHPTGAYMADIMLRYERTGKPEKVKLTRNDLTIDYERMQMFNFSKSDFPEGTKFVNEPVSVLKEYKGTIITTLIVLLVLLLALFTSIHYLRINRKLNNDLKLNNEKLKIAKEEADEANKMKSAFIANMSHEIRTPLNAVLGFTQLITDDTYELSQEELKEYGKYITTNAETLMNLVNDILDISKLDAGTMKFNMSDVDLTELCKVGGESAKTNLNPEVQVVIIEPDKPIMTHSDKQRLLQVLNNLLTNAKKFTSKGTITIELKVDTVTEMAVISVSDTGTGIPAEKAEAVFQRFTQLDGFKQGAGLGLSICRSFIEHLGGRIWLDTSYTGGARFVFTQPLLPPPRKTEITSPED